MSPAVEQTRSLGTEVAGMERYALASGDSKGYLERFSLVIAVALALDGGRDATAFRVVCPFNVFVTCAAGFSRELWWFCMCFCIVLVLATVYSIVFLQCLHIVFVSSVTLSPFLISTGKPKCCHTNDLNVAGGSSILISPSRSIMLTSQLTTRQLFTSTRNLVAF